MNINTITTNNYNNKNCKQKDNTQINKTLQGVLVDNHLRMPLCQKLSFNDIQDSLLINNSEKYYASKPYSSNAKESAFDTKKAIIPLIAGTTAIAGGCFALSAALKKSSLSLLKTKSYEHLPDLAINMNIREEPQFAIYRAVRDPNFKNIMGMTAVFIMSGITIASKNFVDGYKEIWLKKRSADIEKNLQENLISVERDVFSGKLKVVNDMMKQNIKYFNEIINPDDVNYCPDIACFKNSNSNKIFKSFKMNFKGDEKFNDKFNNDKSEKKLDFKYGLLFSGIILGVALLGKLSYSNLKKTMQNTQTFANEYAENIINAIEKISEKSNKKDIPSIVELLKSICAKPQLIKETGKKYNLSDEEIQKIIQEVEQSKKTIFADAPTALGGIPKKVQYYCYIDEPRGHLYNWLLNPENKFTKYIFTAFTATGALGYIFEQSMDAIKQAAVMNENAKTELDLKKQLVELEIESFKVKKESAINPLIDSFTMQAKNGIKSKKELKQIADNILLEIKNGPPYVYN